MPPKREFVGKFLTDLFGPQRVSSNPADRQAYSRDLWPRMLLEARAGTTHPAPDWIVRPETTEEIAELLAWAQENKVPVVPWGGGSGVCGAAVPAHRGIVVDLKRMDRILNIDAVSHTATVQTGILGQRLENELNRNGFTLGHFPSSIYCSTLGGWIATRSAGQLSTGYGNIEDMVLGIEAVLPDGEILKTKAVPRSATGPDIARLLIGSEGTLAVITQAVLALNPAPEAHRCASYLWESVSEGLDGIRKVMQTGLKPSMVRLYDELDTKIALKEEGEDLQGCLLLIRFEGHPEIVEAQFRVADGLFRDCGAQALGPGPADRWWAHRYGVSYKMSPVLYEEGTFLDTIEVAATWDRLETPYHAVRGAVSPDCLILAHFSHAYRQGSSVYFTFVGKKPGEEIEVYDRIWEKAMRACLDHGGTISHHHGIGRLKVRWMMEELGEGGLNVLRAVKKALDKNGILNPGNLGLRNE